MQKRVAELHLACEEYDQALLLQVASSILGQYQKPETALGEDAKLRSWLQSSVAENESKRMASLAQRADGTLQWVLTTPELKDWRLADASTKATTLWLTDLPGVGKSCISAYLGELLPRQYPDDLVLSFFCKRESPGLNTVFSIIKTLCYQLMRADGFYRKFLQETPDLPKTNSKDDILFLVDKLLRKPITAGPGEQTIFILLDGLDELEDVSHTPKGLPSAKSEAESFLEQLITIPRLKVLVTSRRQPQLDSVLSSCGAVRQIKPVDNAHDIQHYVAHRVSASPALQRGFSEMKTDPLENFASRANGVFLWVSAVLDILERAVSTQAFKDSLETTHPTMSSIYDDIFQRAEKRGSIGLINEVLNWTSVLPSPFTVHQMALAVEFSGGDRVLGMGKFLRTECGAFLDLVHVWDQATARLPKTPSRCTSVTRLSKPGWQIERETSRSSPMERQQLRVSSIFLAAAQTSRSSPMPSSGGGGIYDIAWELVTVTLRVRRRKADLLCSPRWPLHSFYIYTGFSPSKKPATG